MVSHPEASALGQNPIVQHLIDRYRRDAHIESHRLTLPPYEKSAVIYREGLYPLNTEEGIFSAVLLRTQYIDGTPGGACRVVYNRDGLQYDPQSVLIINDAIPTFLKELSSKKIQQDLAESRLEIFTQNGPGFLVQTRATDIHDGEFRLLPEFQDDINQEQWYARALAVMRKNPGMTIHKAQDVLLSHGYKQPKIDPNLGVATVLAYFYRGRDVSSLPNLQVHHLTADDYVDPFELRDEKDRSDVRDIEEIIDNAVPNTNQEVAFNNTTYSITTLAKYPIMRNGIELSVVLYSVGLKGERGFRTFRIVQFGDMSQAYVRVDSICTNGVQAGDTHCECLCQIEHEFDRASEGIPFLLISERDSEGRGHGEGKKGATLALQRKLSSALGVHIGNGVAAQLFYHGTGDPVDARTYDSMQVILMAHGIHHIVHLVTDNADKIASIRQVCQVDEVVSADVQGGVSQEAELTRGDKLNGLTGVAYTYAEHIVS